MILASNVFHDQEPVTIISGKWFLDCGSLFFQMPPSIWRLRVRGPTLKILQSLATCLHLWQVPGEETGSSQGQGSECYVLVLAPEVHRKSPASVVPLYRRRWQMTSVALVNNYTKNSLWRLYASTWLGHGTQMVGQASFWMLLWGCFWMRVTFLLVGWVKQIVLQNVGVPHPISWRSE